MAIALMGTLDLSVVTDRLVKLIEDAFADSALWPPPNGPGPDFPFTVSGSMPESVRDAGDCQVSMYLFHVSRNASQTNVPPEFPYAAGPPLPTSIYQIPYLSLPLDLRYLLTAYAGPRYLEEQKSMSVAMKALHENPIIPMNVTLDGTVVPETFTVTLELDTADELGRLWQAVSAPMRLSAVYTASVVFVTPEADANEPAPEVEEVIVVADPARLPLDSRGQVTGTSIASSYVVPDGTVKPYDLAPAVASAGDEFDLHGGGLDQPTAAQLFLLAPGQPPVDVTAWRDDGPVKSSSNAHVVLPLGVGAAPGQTPPPGVYQLQVGSAQYTSNATPFSIAARVDRVPGQTILQPVAGLFTLHGAGFAAGATEILLGTTALAESGGAPGPGQFNVAGGATIDFRAPATLSPGTYAVRVRVNSIESRPAWWVTV